jgi:hypothetical protein
VTFRNSAAERAYKERVTRFIKAFLCTELDRVPVMVLAGNFSIQYNGLNLKQVIYDPTLISHTWTKFINDFYEDMDDFLGPAGISCGRILDILDYKSFMWPGHGLPEDA